MKRAFTLIELLVVVAIIGALSGLIMAAANIVKGKQLTFAAKSQMQGISLAISNYLGDYGILGDQRVASPTDFAQKPALFLVQRPVKGKRDPYLESKLGELRDGLGAVAAPESAETITNPWGYPVRFIVTNEQSGASTGYDHSKLVQIISGPAATASPKDMSLVFNLDRDAWEWQ
jgi:prepilin-type N-terminal cleavage/methylation domain-containing protein